MGKLSEAEFTTIKQLLAKGYDGKKGIYRRVLGRVRCPYGYATF